MTPAGLALLKRHEGLRLAAYRDPVGILTIGYGHTGTDVHEGQTITEERAEDLLRQDVGTAERAVARLVTVPLNDNQRDALASFVFNVGVRAFERSTLLQKLNQGNYSGAADELLRWDKAGGNTLAGLARRRKDERALFLSQTSTSQTSTSQEPRTMAPFIAAALPALTQAIPSLIRLFGKGERSEQNAQAAEKVAAIVQEATGATNVQEAVERMQRDPEARQRARDAVEQRWFELQEAGGGGIAAARDYNLKSADVPFWKQPAFVIAVLLLPLVYYVAVVVLQLGDFSQETKAMVVAAIITGVLGGITGFFLGSSVSSRAKDEMIAKRP
jgi:lysozyme